MYTVIPISLCYCWLLLLQPSVLSAPHKAEWHSWWKKRAQESMAQSLVASEWTRHPQAPVEREPSWIRSMWGSIQIFWSYDSVRGFLVPSCFRSNWPFWATGGRSCPRSDLPLTSSTPLYYPPGYPRDPDHGTLSLNQALCPYPL